MCNFRESSSHAVPLGLMYLAAVVEKSGHQAKVLDVDNLKMSWTELEDRLKKENPDVLGIGGTTLSMPALHESARIAKKSIPNVKIIVGGFGPTIESEKVLKDNSSIDLVCRGESEETIVDLFHVWQNKKTLGEVDGIVYRLGVEIVRTKDRSPILDLDKIPFPAYHLLEPSTDKYTGIYGDYEGMCRPTFVMFASRGCPHRCTFCSLGRKIVRWHNPKRVVDEIELYVKRYGAKSIQLYDDEFIGMSVWQNKWVADICDEIIKRGLNNVSYLVQGRCSQFVELEVLQKMYKAGFRWIWWGVESGSQKVLDSIKKDIKVENIIRTFSLAKQAGIKNLMFVMVGFPEETEEDIKKTASLIAKVNPDKIRIHIVTPLPGSEMWQVLDEGKMIDDYDILHYTMRIQAVHHTKYFTGDEIVKNYEMLKFRFEDGYWYFIAVIFRSFFSLEGLKSFPRRMKKIFIYSYRWLKLFFQFNRWIFMKNKLQITREVVQHCQKYIKGKTIDYGCGRAKYKSIITSQAKSYVAFDMVSGPNVDVVGDVLKTPFQDNEFDTVISNQVLEHVSKPWLMIKEIGRILKPDGICILTAPFLAPYHPDPQDNFRFTTSGLTSMFRNEGFEVLECGGYGLFFTVLSEFIHFSCFDPYAKSKRWSGFIMDKIRLMARFLDRFVKGDKIYTNVYVVARKSK